MAYRIEVGPKADGQLGELDPAVGSAVERKIIWLSENAAVMIHRRLVGMAPWIKPDYVTRPLNASSAGLGLAVGQKGNGFVAYPNIDRENPL